MKKRRLFAFSTILVLVLSVFATSAIAPNVQAAACPQKPYMTITPTFAVSGDYTIWAQEYRDAGSATKVFISVDNGANCDEFGASSAGSWQWVQGAGGRLEKRINAGTPNIRLYASGGSIALANVLFTLDDTCVPTGDGTNCVQKPLDLSITGIRQAEVVSGDVVIETVIGNLTTDSVRVEYYFDNASQPYSTTTSAPYCLVLTNGACAPWPSSSLSNGQHTLTVRAISGGSPTEQTISFTVNNTSASPTPPASRPSPSPSPSARPTAPAPTPTPLPTPTSAPTTPDRSTALLRQGLSNYTSNTEGVGNGSPTTTTNNSGGVVERVSNSNAPVGSGFVAGLSLEGQLKGKVVVSAPKNLIFYAGDKAELLAGGKVIETKEITQQNTPVSFVLDTTKLPNGKTIVSLRVTRATGEISTYSSNVEIANGTLQAGVGSVQSKWPAILLLISLFIAFAVGIFFFIRWYRRRQEYNMMHNTLDYSYVQPENPYMAPAGAAMAVFVGISAVLFIGGNQSYAANIGYIVSTVQASQISGFPAEFSLENDASAGINFVRMSDLDDCEPNPGERPETGHNHGDDGCHSPTPPTPPPTTPPTTPPVPPSAPPATTADYDSNLEMMLAATSRNRNFDNAARAVTPSAALTNDPALYGDPDEYNTHFAYNPRTLGPGAVPFRVECAFSHFNYDDPIVYPNRPGRAHLHMNFGNTHTNAYSTYETLIDSGNGTCSGMELNRTGYWTPALIDPQGNARIPARILVYYKSGGADFRDLEPYPEGLRFLMNNEINFRSGAEGGSGSSPFQCNYGPPHAAVTVNCPGNQLHQIVTFPRCIKRNVNFITDYATAWVHATGGWWYSECPLDSIPIPYIQYNILYDVEPGEDSSSWFLSSDVDPNTRRQTAANGNSNHGDWFGAWNKEVNRIHLERCNNNNAQKRNGGGECGFGSLVPCIRTNENFVCQEYQPGLPRTALKAINPRPPVNKVPIAQLHSELCPQAPLPQGSAPAAYAWCAP